MAHLIELHTAGKGEVVLFNLDTVISIERDGNCSTIHTRWNRQNVRETLEEIMEKSRQGSNSSWITQENV
tara:strand:- start:3243 stop:3452 length:210 start_codon:yes stop_codon:yes gene_type:complete